MSDSGKPRRALGLCSGGLDSMLAGLLLRAQGIEVEWVCFETPFFDSRKARRAARQTGIPLTVLPITARFLPLLRNPPAGYGKRMNPCMDCHSLMFRIAGELLRERGFDFLFSGEVLGQRPMSQTLPSLRYVEKHSGMGGLILRPLSAKLLPETIPEQRGWVDRERLLAIRGRGRKEQIALARTFGIEDYPAPAGGCLLTDKGYSARLRDLFAHGAACTEAELQLLKFGRHFRLHAGAKLLVGRTEKENEAILRFRDPTREVTLDVRDYPSPIGLLQGSADPETVLRAAAICLGYTRAPRSREAAVVVTFPSGREEIYATPLPPEDSRAWLL